MLSFLSDHDSKLATSVAKYRVGPLVFAYKSMDRQYLFLNLKFHFMYKVRGVGRWGWGWGLGRRKAPLPA